MLSIKEILEDQLKRVERNINNHVYFEQKATLELVKVNILLALQKYEN